MHIIKQKKECNRLISVLHFFFLEKDVNHTVHFLNAEKYQGISYFESMQFSGLSLKNV